MLVLLKSDNTFSLSDFKNNILSVVSAVTWVIERKIGSGADEL